MTAVEYTPELAALMEHVKVIEQGLAEAADVLWSLNEIRRLELYRAAKFDTFEGYCRGRFEDRMGDASRQGAAFETTVELLLLIEGWTIIDRHWREPTTDVEIDLVAKDPSGEMWWIECKGSWLATRNGLERTDTLKKAIGSATVLRHAPERHPYMLVTSHLPRVGSAGATWLQLVDSFDRVRLVGFVDVPRATNEAD